MVIMIFNDFEEKILNLTVNFFIYKKFIYFPTVYRDKTGEEITWELSNGRRYLKLSKRKTFATVPYI